MKTVFTWLSTRSRTSSYVWSPAVDIGQGWMICTLNPFGTMN